MEEVFLQPEKEEPRRSTAPCSLLVACVSEAAVEAALNDGLPVSFRHCRSLHSAPETERIQNVCQDAAELLFQHLLCGHRSPRLTAASQMAMSHSGVGAGHSLFTDHLFSQNIGLPQELGSRSSSGALLRTRIQHPTQPAASLGMWESHEDPRGQGS